MTKNRVPTMMDDWTPEQEAMLRRSLNARMTDPRVQTDDQDEPLFEDGPFHVEVFDLSGGPAWGVYDAFEGRVRLYFPTVTEAIDAAQALAAAALISPDALDAEYDRRWEIASRHIKAW